MPTNNIQLKTTIEYNNEYTPIYTPIYPLLLANGRAKQYAADVGQIQFKHLEAVGDIRTQRYTPKDTHIHQIAAMDQTKTFKKYFKASQFINSSLQTQDDVQRVIQQVLDENHAHMDDLLLLGEGTSASTMLNNGLFWSDDPNYELESSTQISSTDRLYALHTAINTNVTDANQIAGRKLLLFYGTSTTPLVNSLFPDVAAPFRNVLQNTIGADYTIVDMPAKVTPSGTNGWIIVNYDQCILHYTVLPQLFAQGFDEKNMQYWFNFLMGSCMVEVAAENAIIRQPVTYQ